MIKATLTLIALAALAACDASMMSTGPVDPMEDDFDQPAVGADPPGTTGPNATPWWGV